MPTSPPVGQARHGGAPGSEQRGQKAWPAAHWGGVSARRGSWAALQRLDRPGPSLAEWTPNSLAGSARSPSVAATEVSTTRGRPADPPGARHRRRGVCREWSVARRRTRANWAGARPGRNQQPTLCGASAAAATPCAAAARSGCVGAPQSGSAVQTGRRRGRQARAVTPDPELRARSLRWPLRRPLQPKGVERGPTQRWPAVPNSAEATGPHRCQQVQQHLQLLPPSADRPKPQHSRPKGCCPGDDGLLLARRQEQRAHSPYAPAAACEGSAGYAPQDQGPS